MHASRISSHSTRRHVRHILGNLRPRVFPNAILAELKSAGSSFPGARRNSVKIDNAASMNRVGIYDIKSRSRTLNSWHRDQTLY